MFHLKVIAKSMLTARTAELANCIQVMQEFGEASASAFGIWKRTVSFLDLLVKVRILARTRATIVKMVLNVLQSRMRLHSIANASVIILARSVSCCIHVLQIITKPILLARTTVSVCQQKIKKILLILAIVSIHFTVQSVKTTLHVTLTSRVKIKLSASPDLKAIIVVIVTLVSTVYKKFLAKEYSGATTARMKILAVKIRLLV